eukprot:gnl/MRDRNA2_/MRDRNA2_157969_c0_seq1.p1 gnl/MRDRNA2_/MRDRNA2_157969_c0~~gnl/MRDRNA2_/MRDRNA2_157969_c0_seq1.p1  ORF type:complete len:124 (-),score=14.23 gnl/MRDRNA2_/MRDRNA2_157969_c0_seq1:104-430(-)
MTHPCVWVWGCVLFPQAQDAVRVGMIELLVVAAEAALVRQLLQQEGVSKTRGSIHPLLLSAIMNGSSYLFGSMLMNWLPSMACQNVGFSWVTSLVSWSLAVFLCVCLH